MIQRIKNQFIVSILGWFELRILIQSINFWFKIMIKRIDIHKYK